MKKDEKQVKYPGVRMAIDRVRRMADIAICTHAGDELLTIRLEPSVVERLHTRSVGKFHEYVRDTIGGLIRQFVNM